MSERYHRRQPALLEYLTGMETSCNAQNQQRPPDLDDCAGLDNNLWGLGIKRARASLLTAFCSLFRQRTSSEGAGDEMAMETERGDETVISQ